MITHDGIDITYGEIGSLSNFITTLERLNLYGTWGHGMNISQSTITGEILRLTVAIKKRMLNSEHKL